MANSDHNVHDLLPFPSLIFTVDPEYKTIELVTSGPEEVTRPIFYPVQYNHCSDRYTFRIPKTIEGHDMSLCSDVQIHYVNIKADVEIIDNEVKTTNVDETERVSGIYSVDDIMVQAGSGTDDPDEVIFTWTVSDDATQYSGILAFALHFRCVTGETVEYSWNTRYYSNLFVLKGINNTDIVVSKYTDVLQQWYAKLFEMTGGTIEHNTGEAMSFWIGTQAEYDALPEEEKIIRNCMYMFEDDPTLSDIKEKVNEHEFTLTQLSTSLGNVATTTYVNEAIEAAITNALGGSY